MRRVSNERHYFRLTCDPNPSEHGHFLMLIDTTTDTLSASNPPTLNAIGCSIKWEFSAPNLDIPGTFFHTGP